MRQLVRGTRPTEPGSGRLLLLTTRRVHFRVAGSGVVARLVPLASKVVPLSADDMLAIQQLVARYNFAIDSGDGEAYARCFVPDGRFSYSDSDVIEGGPALAKFGASLSRLGLIRHVVTSLLMEGGGGRASCRSYCQVFGVDGEGRSYVLSQGVYHDSLVQIDETWRFEERRYVMDPAGPPAG